MPHNKQEPMLALNHSFTHFKWSTQRSGVSPLLRAHRCSEAQSHKLKWLQAMLGGQAGMIWCWRQLLKQREPFLRKIYIFKGSLEEAERATPAEWLWARRWAQINQTPWMFFIVPVSLILEGSVWSEALKSFLLPDILHPFGDAWGHLQEHGTEETAQSWGQFVGLIWMEEFSKSFLLITGNP